MLQYNDGIEIKQHRQLWGKSEGRLNYHFVVL